jgi:hypothetical protein
MTQHFTRNTVSAPFYCAKCAKSTQHRIDGGRKGPCLECIAKLDQLYTDHRKFRVESVEDQGGFDWT